MWRHDAVGGGSGETRSPVARRGEEEDDDAKMEVDASIRSGSSDAGGSGALVVVRSKIWRSRSSGIGCGGWLDLKGGGRRLWNRGRGFSRGFSGLAAGWDISLEVRVCPYGLGVFK